MQKIGLALLLSLVAFQLYSQSKNFIDRPYIETDAKVDTLVVPNRIYLTIVLKESDSRNKKSTEELENLMQNVLKILEIDTERDLSLLDFSSNFKKYFLADQKILKTKMYSLIVKDALTAGRVLAELEKAGISNVFIEKTEFSGAEDLILKLKSKAVLKAKKSAESMLAPLNQKVGPAIFVSDLQSVSNQLQGMAEGIRIRGASCLYESGGSQPIATQFNKIRFSVTVDVKFSIE